MQEELIDPQQSLTEDLFLFVSTLTPIVNINLFNTNNRNQLLLARREDYHHGIGWHISSGCLGIKETLEERILRTALSVLGTDVEYDITPICVREWIMRDYRQLLQNQMEGLHGISFLYACSLPCGYKMSSEFNEVQAIWFESEPDNLLEARSILYGDVTKQWFEGKKRCTMPFLFHKTNIEGLLVIEPHMFLDDRGLYKKCYEKYIFAENGITCDFTENSDLYSKKGALRGLHYQTEESQAKLIHVIQGKLFDVAVDLREYSPTFGKYHAELIDAEEHKVVFIPEEFAHGFIALTDDTLFSYQCSGRYIPKACGGIRWDDPTLNIPWPLEEYGIKEIIATEKDKNWPTFIDYKIMMGID